MPRPDRTRLPRWRHFNLVRRKAQDELVVRVGVQKPTLGCDGEGRLPVRVAPDAVHAEGLSGH